MTKRTRSIHDELVHLSDTEKAKLLAKYFQTGEGGYGEGDIFIGVTVPMLRKLAKENYQFCSLKDLSELLRSEIHEERAVALLMLILCFQKGNNHRRADIVRVYLAHTPFINNWDLVDLSARDILGGYFFDRSRKTIYRLARSKLIWERRMAVLATFYFINHDDFSDSILLAKRLLGDPHDLIHKAVGWMLREVGKKNMAQLEAFLDEHVSKMPRTMLRYAIERFPESKRKVYLMRK
jgi:3-methyladenine DNA glycosylase AlkD